MTERLAGRGRWVLDTNVLVSRVLWPQGTPSRAFAQALQWGGTLLVSPATLAELHEVLMRPRLDRYASPEHRLAFLQLLPPVLELIHPATPIRACRDPKDDKFLEVAVHGQADALVTGDADLLALHPFHGVPILSPADFLQHLGDEAPDAHGHRVQEPPASYRISALTPLPARLNAFLRARHRLDAPLP
ncbi:MAG: putative toxin-antitoxin system toxin component, PIN family [Comamonadaceae bacterium]|nr:MAG: putative toxin-antitoxin system toxin component, PIN family [Comamonadaceae bacterium]